MTSTPSNSQSIFIIISIDGNIGFVFIVEEMSVVFGFNFRTNESK